jgi:hypothetical protein
VNISIHGEEDREGLEVPPRSLCGVKVKRIGRDWKCLLDLLVEWRDRAAEGEASF